MKKVALAIVFVVAFVVLAGYPVVKRSDSESAAKNKVSETIKEATPGKAEARKVVRAEAELKSEAEVGPESEPKADSAEEETNIGSELESEPEPQVYVLVNLGEQHLSVVRATEISEEAEVEVLFETGIVSGTANTSRATPTGTYTIYSKVPGKYLQPRGGSRVWVNYWMPFNGGIGLHDASWRDVSQFGTDQYMWSGSHGCINLPYNAAAKIYDLVEVGTTVIVVE